MKKFFKQKTGGKKGGTVSRKFTRKRSSQAKVSKPGENQGVEMQKQARVTALKKNGKEQADASEIRRIIAQQREALAKEHLAQEEQEIAPELTDIPEKFDGVHGDEQAALLHQELLAEQRKSVTLEHELRMIRKSLQDEREHFEAQMRELKRELNRSTPKQDHSFFSLSKELNEAVTMIHNLSTTVPVKTTGTMEPVTLPNLAEQPVAPIQQTSPVTTTSTEQPEPASAPDLPKTVTKPEEEKDKEKPKKKRGKKGVMITGGVVVLVMMLSGALVSYSGMLTPKVDEALVAEYLEKQGSVAGAESSEQPEETQAAAEARAKEEEVPSADVAFDQTEWATVTEPLMGITMKYPENAVKITKSESSLTFLRKQGYLFKVQRIETGLSLKEYWEQIKATTYEYDEEYTTLASKEALHLKLTEKTKYPGNRYLVADEGGVFDVWYATESEIFSADDIKRVQYMLNSIIID